MHVQLQLHRHQHQAQPIQNPPYNVTRRQASTNSSAISAGAVGTFLSLINVIVGFFFQAVLAARLGMGALADAFQICWTIVTFVAVVQFTMVTSLLVPRLQVVVDGVECIGRSRLPVAMGAMCGGVQTICALTLTTGDLKMLLLTSAPSQIFIGAATVPQAVAYASRRFWVAGAGPVMNGFGLLAVALPAQGHLTSGILGAAISVGYLSQWLATSIGTRDLARFAYRGRTIAPRLFLGVLAFTLVSKLQPVLERVMSYQIAAGATAALGYGQKISQGLLLFGTFSIATASAASLARHRNAKNVHGAADLMAQITIATMVFAAVVTALALPAAYPVVVVLFQRGAFTSEDSRYVANIVVLQLPWVLAGALAGVLTPYLYIDSRYAKVLVASLAGLCVTVLVGLALSEVVPRYAVAIASSSGMIASLLAIIVVLSRNDIWLPYCHFMKIRWRVAAYGFWVLVMSCTIVTVLHVLAGEPTFAESVIATLVVVSFAGVVLLFSRTTRTGIWEAINAKL